jgi:hypothetical protein
VKVGRVRPGRCEWLPVLSCCCGVWLELGSTPGRTCDLSGWNRSWAVHTAAACDFCRLAAHFDRSHRSQQRRCFLSLVNFSLWRPWRAIFPFPAAGEIKAEAYRVSRLGPIQLGRPGERVCQAVVRSPHGGAGARRNR